MSEDNERALLESFVVNNPELERLEALLAEFNIFEAVGAVRQELRHSDFLAFLLDPTGNHRLGDAFLKRLLKHVLAGVADAPVSAVEVDAADLDSAVVQREWQNIDILVHDPANNLVCAIENKIGSAEHSNQLRHYQETVERHFPHTRRIFIFLTPEGERPTNEAYLALSYEDLVEIVDAVHRSHESTLGDAVRILLDHYTTMLRRHIVTDSEIVELCRKLYRQHRQALDLIYEHRPDLQSGLREHLEKLVQESGKQHALALEHSSKVSVRFFPLEWDHYAPLKAGAGWVPSGRMLLYEFLNRADRLALFLYIGPGPQPTRQALLQAFQAHPKLFNQARGQLNQKWKTVYKLEILKADDYSDPDFETLQAKIQTFWQHFLDRDLPAINAVVAAVSWDTLTEAKPDNAP